jgi:membrane protease YdiL (CAAX protease family)
MLSEKPWQPEAVLQLVIRLFASMFLGMVLASWLHSVPWLGTGQMRYLGLMVGALSFHGVGLILIHYFLRAHGLSWDEAFGLMSPRLGRAVVLAVLVALAVLPITWSLGQLSAQLMSSFHVDPVVQGPVQMLQSAGEIPMQVLIGFLAVVVAPCVEELVFRGLIYPTLKQHGYPRLALWGSSLLFAAIHSNLMILLPLTLLLYETTDNLIAPILTHSIFNFVNFFFVVAQPLVSPSLPS